MMTAPDPPSDQGVGNILPLVSYRNGNRGVWLFASVAAVAAVLLFLTLDARRETITAPSIGPALNISAGVISSPPDLYIPPSHVRRLSSGPPFQAPAQTEGVATISAETNASVTAPVKAGRVRQRLQSADVGAIPYPIVPYVPPQPQVVYDANAQRPIAVERSWDPGSQADRVRASQFANPAATVPKGTLITAVLETALDSTRAGYARAIISRDVFGFDGSRVLIPKGSRLVGEYKADLAPGQKRALIQWQRLMRPDGVIVNLDSPAADPLGRAGVQGKVNSHFFERFGGAILQSVLNIGSQVAASKISDGAVIYAIPVPTDALPIASPDKVQPTLKVRQGTSISVFVAKDLDFSTVER